MTPRRVLVVGSGGREHALAARLRDDPSRPEVLVAPGNAGIAREHRCLGLDSRDAGAVIDACRTEGVDLVVVGPEALLDAGLADALASAGIRVFGAARAGARLESSKWFAKQVMAAAGVPTARAERFDDASAARDGLGRFDPPWVIKADGLAAGKGVLVTGDRGEAEAFLAACLSGARFGESGRRVVVEAFLAGEELSVMAVCDGERAVLLPAARDYKRARDGDRGPNTGGMGGYAPSEALDAAAATEVERSIVAPTLAELRRRDIAYRGTLYVGLMRTAEGFHVVEFNARFGDPETQVILPRVGGELTELLAGAAEGRVDPAAVHAVDGATVAVALVDEAYPEPGTGGSIRGLDGLRDHAGVFLRYASGEPDGDCWRFTGGRVVYVCATGDMRATARARAYAAVATLGGHGWRHRSDIAAEGHPAGTTRDDGVAGTLERRGGTIHAA